MKGNPRFDFSSLTKLLFDVVEYLLLSEGLCFEVPERPEFVAENDKEQISRSLNVVRVCASAQLCWRKTYVIKSDICLNWVANIRQMWSVERVFPATSSADRPVDLFKMRTYLKLFRRARTNKEEAQLHCQCYRELPAGCVNTYVVYFQKLANRCLEGLEARSSGIRHLQSSKHTQIEFVSAVTLFEMHESSEGWGRRLTQSGRILTMRTVQEHTRQIAEISSGSSLASGPALPAEVSHISREVYESD